MTPLNEEAKARISEFSKELKALLSDHDILFWEGGIVRVAPAGAPPTTCTVEIEGVWDENVEWRGSPGGLQVGDEVLVWENPVTHRREIHAGSGATATKPFVHDHHDDDQGGDALNPATITPQTFVVGPSPAPYDTLGEAVAAAVAFGPGAATPCAIRVQGIVTAEAGDVTIPQYCHVEGVGEGSVIGMGANDILMTNSDASLLDLVITTTDDYAVNVTASVTLRNVRAEVSGTALAGFRVGGGSPKFYDCICDPSDATNFGFYIGGAGITLLDHCTADDSTFFTNALDITGTATVISRYCKFAGAANDVNQAGGTNWCHFDDQFDPNNIVLGGSHAARPGKRFNQTVIVAEEGGDFQTVLEAVTWVNAQGDAAADKRYGILVLTGNFSEDPGYTVPSYVHVAGMGEGSRLELTNGTIDMADDSSLQDVVITGSATAVVLRANNADCELFNVKIIASYQPSYGVDIRGDSDCKLYHVVVEYTVSGNTYAFAVSGTATPMLWDCKAEDATNINDALNIADSACVVATRYCMFHGSGNDVWTGAASTWIYHQDDFDPDNCTINGASEPADGQEVVYFPCTKTVTTDFATIQAAVDWFKNRLLCAACKIDIDTGATYNETLVIEDVFCAAEGRLELEGDTRGMAGATWVDNAVITCQDANAGSGTCTLANAGAVITVTGSVANPDFDADGWGNGDTVMTRDNAGAIATYTISATLNNTITLTVAAPALGNTGTSLTLVPDTVIAPSGAGTAVSVVESRGILLDGLYLDATAGASGNGVIAQNGGGVACENVLAEADTYGFYAAWSGFVGASDGACTAIDCTSGFDAIHSGSVVFADYGCAIGCSGNGFIGTQLGLVRANYAVAAGNDRGFRATYFGVWYAGGGAYALDNTSYGFATERFGGGYCDSSRTLGSNGIADYYSSYNSYMYAGNTNVGGPTYSPAASDTEGNVYAIITWS